jgi:hypothetical protein
MANGKLVIPNKFMKLLIFIIGSLYTIVYILKNDEVIV